MNEEEINSYLRSISTDLLNSEKNNIVLNREWTKTFPNEPGNYAIFESNELVYTAIAKVNMDEVNNIRYHISESGNMYAAIETIEYEQYLIQFRREE